MDNEILYSSIKARERGEAYLDYYIIPENISADYCDLKCYGIKIRKTVLYGGGGKTIEIKQINNVFYRYDDAIEFLAGAEHMGIEPYNLREFMENYITERIVEKV